MMNRVEMNEEMVETVAGGSRIMHESWIMDKLRNLFNTEEKSPEKEIRGPKIPETIALVP